MGEFWVCHIHAPAPRHLGPSLSCTPALLFISSQLVRGSTPENLHGESGWARFFPIIWKIWIGASGRPRRPEKFHARFWGKRAPASPPCSKIS